MEIRKIAIVKNVIHIDAWLDRPGMSNTYQALFTLAYVSATGRVEQFLPKRGEILATHGNWLRVRPGTSETF